MSELTRNPIKLEDTLLITVVRFGHAVKGTDHSESSALDHALAVAAGSQALAPRKPVSVEAVTQAEAILKAIPRPVYAFVGLLHPELGTVGLIISPGWARRCLQGVSKCDSGGLLGRLGGFACIEDGDLEGALLEVSLIEDSLDQWLVVFTSELRKSYLQAEHGYVSGEEPDCSGWKDIRSRCIRHARASGSSDRRLWSWEVRLEGSPAPDEVECLVVSPEMRKRLEVRRMGGTVIPDSLAILAGSVTERGIHWFNSPCVHRAFFGVRG